ncbi:serine C-palmitoyltransferase subunit [Dictyostelium purpureum]|uniref:serine C-palmitoyltransferase n=1 Tax=Dictyostelium purpureum TaxID=5786 RepID=F0ZR95_DICPU|nr:serine C-palmitoyltransferase subunit [Dictyostelium purpureum]EGC33514.1 serine C-palmitoyltransferase subunit [Dictyostelium purpureum]|eukprot:XP_003289939.1 serine C-palmitoyltransferase subunit [Dictyostelium purpureum]
MEDKEDFEHEDHVGIFPILMLYISYAFIIFNGKLAEFVGKLKGERYLITPDGYAPLFVEFEYFYQRRMYGRIKDAWDRPINSIAGAWINVMPRSSKHYSQRLELTGEKPIRCLNLGSYNYLGFAQSEGPVADKVVESIYRYGTYTGSTSSEVGLSQAQRELEQLTARFIGKEDAMVFEMGFATNSGTLPALIGKGGLIISDSLNHASLATGCKNTGCKVKVFRHNDAKHLEEVVRQSIIEGQPRTRRPWTMILIIIEGIYSMEGETSNLPEIIAIKKKYKCYLYVDEAHSIGALGKTGRGVLDYYGIPASEVDIMMGTYTKSFGSIGGYVAADKSLIDHLRQSSFSAVYANSMSPPCAVQALEALRCIMGEDGTDIGAQKLKQLHDNSNYFRERIREMGFVILGNKDSPVIPLMLFNPAKLSAFSRLALERHIAVVVVGYPATPLTEPRTRFCISASHTREDLDWACEIINEIGDEISLKFNKNKYTNKLIK